MLVIGLAGGISTGKSTVSTLLRQSSPPIPIIDADILARTVVSPGTPALASIVRTFGSSILLPDGSLDRKKLGTVIFNDEGKRRQLNGIVHPAVRRAMMWEVLGYWMRGYKYCVVDVPLLIEGGLWKWVGLVVVVSCSEETQLERLIARDGSSQTDALARIKSQMPISQKTTYADILIDNSGTPAELEAQVQSLITRLDADAGWSWRLTWLLPPLGLLSALSILLFRRFKLHRRETDKKTE